MKQVDVERLLPLIEFLKREHGSLNKVATHIGVGKTSIKDCAAGRQKSVTPETASKIVQGVERVRFKRGGVWVDPARLIDVYDTEDYPDIRFRKRSAG